MEEIMIMEIIYENETAQMIFYYQKAVESLQRRIRSYQVPEDIQLLQWIHQTFDNDITINASHPLAGRFCYLIFDLITDGQGIAYCNNCCSQYKATDLTINKISTIQRPSRTKKVLKLLKREFNIKGKFNTPGFGTKQLLCPEDHMLLSVRSWMT